MSRIGKKLIEIPKGVEVKIQDQNIIVKGPKGELEMKIMPEIKVELKDEKIFIKPFIGKEDFKKIKAFWGLVRMLIYNMIEGVTNGFEKRLEIKGVGYKAEVLDKEIVLYVGFSHPVKIDIPQGIKISVEKNIIIVSGIKKDLVGQLASNIKKTRPVEPYKGKGIRYQGEVVIKKAGKKVATSK